MAPVAVVSVYVVAQTGGIVSYSINDDETSDGVNASAEMQ